MMSEGIMRSWKTWRVRRSMVSDAGRRKSTVMNDKGWLGIGRGLKRP